MEFAKLRIKGHWAHFKKPETNNNPLTHDFITKSAMIGMIGAILGVDRERMGPLFPIFSEDLRYGVALENSVWKQSWAFTLRRFDPDKTRLEPSRPAPRAFEFLREPQFIVILALTAARSEEHFRHFLNMVENSEAHYDPVLGLHNCPAEIELVSMGTASLSNGPFTTQGFIALDRQPKVDIDGGLRIGFERLPSYQNTEMWNPPERYVEVVYTDVRPNMRKQPINGDGEHFRLKVEDSTEEAWCLI